MSKTYVITGAQMGAKLHTRFFNTLLNYCEHRDAELVIAPLRGVSNHGRFIEKIKEEIDVFEKLLLETEDKEVVKSLKEKLQRRRLELKELYPKEIQHLIATANTIQRFNSNIAFNSIQITPTQKKPLTGLIDLAHTSTIFGAPKINLQVVHTEEKSHPRIMVTTGACTQPLYLKSRVGVIAEDNHTYGAIVVDIEDDEIFHLRQLEANGNGEITDLGVRYTGTTKKKVDVEALVLGDVHVMFLDPTMDWATEDMIEKLKPKKVFIHDIFDAFTISHWHQNDLVIQTRKAMKNYQNHGVVFHDDLEQELEQVGEYLANKCSQFPNVEFFIVCSNHDEALDRCIKEGRFIRDPKNSLIGAKLFVDMIENQMMPLEAWLRKHSKYKDQLDRVHFFTRDTSYKVKDIQVANHGDVGLSGTRGSIWAEARAHGKSYIGHKHSPGIYGGVYQVGCSCLIPGHYCKGPNNWMHTNGVINTDGTRTLLNSIGGRWCLKD